MSSVSAAPQADWRTAPLIDTRSSPQARHTPIPARAVHLDPGFWRSFMEMNHSTILPSLLEKLDAAGRLTNFRIAAGQQTGEMKGRDARDSDVHKWLEGACHALQVWPESPLAAPVQEIADLIAAAQDADGYVNTAFVGDRKPLRHTNLRHGHELYVAGHFFMAAVAHHRATGSTQLLDVANRQADYLCKTFGPQGIKSTSGHPGVEMALVELYRSTGLARYLDLVQVLIDRRGSAFPEADLRQRLALVDAKPVRELKELTGAHAVRALYLMSGVTDLYLENGDESLRRSVEALWADTVATKMYVTGGLGARYQLEAFGEAYELPNLRAYAETCAAIANVFWNQRLFVMDPDSRYMDLLEWSLYNGALPGVSLDGNTFFYNNPLEAHEHGDEALPTLNGVEREPFFQTTCCPTNMVRLLASLPGYCYGYDAQGLYVHLYAPSTLSWQLPDQTPVTLIQRTDYPWSGKVEIEVRVEQPAQFTLFVRIPGWSQSPHAAIANDIVPSLRPGTYCAVTRTWQPGDVLSLDLGLAPRFLDANPRLREAAGCYTLTCGPLVYCLEGIDHPDVSNLDLHWHTRAADELRLEWRDDLLQGINVVRGPGCTVRSREDKQWLYASAGTAWTAAAQPLILTAIPYYARANRGRTWMKVWVPTY